MPRQRRAPAAPMRRAPAPPTNPSTGCTGTSQGRSCPYTACANPGTPSGTHDVPASAAWHVCSNGHYRGWSCRWLCCGPHHWSCPDRGPCQYELKQFLECAQNQHDISLCEGFNQVLKECRLQHGGGM
ncbi:hypothetical protein MRX96_057097 [Rhipicephalus microplus]